jgi:hypothetical protein
MGGSGGLEGPEHVALGVLEVGDLAHALDLLAGDDLLAPGVRDRFPDRW